MKNHHMATFLMVGAIISVLMLSACGLLDSIGHP